MNSLNLSTKIFLVSGFILLIFCVASVGILYQAQTRQATQEMDLLLKNETLSLSALVNATTSGGFDFEMSPNFISRYKENNPNAFFRFIDSRKKIVLKESEHAPQINCTESDENKDIVTSDQRIFRVKNVLFQPEIDGGSKTMRSFMPSFVCLVVGIDEAPYKSLVVQTLLSSVPILIALVIFLIGMMLILVRRLTRDLSNLTMALATADFGATHEFPILPAVNTLEVKAVVEKLIGLHAQAADVYREMWLFLGRASHQLKTPVTAMQATLDVLLRKDRSKEELMSGLTDVESATGQLASLTKKLISSSRISFQESPIHRESIDLEEFMHEQIKMFSAQAERHGVRLSMAPISSLKVWANSFLLSEIFGNLIENAILYSPHGKDASVSISWEKEQNNAVIVISDQGVGFPSQVKQAFFKPFVRGDERQVSGSGLGLSIAKKSAQLLGGDVLIRETTAEGSKIAVTLPMINMLQGNKL